eukprot:4253019-Pyramimonas_sp.AAC.1
MNDYWQQMPPLGGFDFQPRGALALYHSEGKAIDRETCLADAPARRFDEHEKFTDHRLRSCDKPAHLSK